MAAMPSIAAGLRIGMGIAWMVIVAAEFFPETPGALVPLVAYHVTQLAIDTWVADRIRRRAPS